jgi:DNA primase large subunit
VGQRKVYIKGGMAYVPQSLQISLVLQAFGSKLEKALEVSIDMPFTAAGD